jgi:hypothetical protein
MIASTYIAVRVRCWLHCQFRHIFVLASIFALICTPHSAAYIHIYIYIHCYSILFHYWPTSAYSHVLLISSFSLPSAAITYFISIAYLCIPGCICICTAFYSTFISVSLSVPLPSTLGLPLRPTSDGLSHFIPLYLTYFYFYYIYIYYFYYYYYYYFYYYYYYLYYYYYYFYYYLYYYYLYYYQ